MNFEERMEKLVEQGGYSDKEFLKNRIEKIIEANQDEWNNVILKRTDEQIESYWANKKQASINLTREMGKDFRFAGVEADLEKLAYDIYTKKSNNSEEVVHE